MLFPNNLEFSALPLSILTLNSIIGFGGNINSIIGLLLNVALLGAIIGFVCDKLEHKWLKIVAIIYAGVRFLLIAIKLTQILINGNTPIFSSYLFSISMYLIISIPIAFSKERVNTYGVEITSAQLIISVLILLICLFLIIIFPLVDYGNLGWQEEWHKCYNCDGTGKVRNDFGWYVTCPSCDGVGGLYY